MSEQIRRVNFDDIARELGAEVKPSGPPAGGPPAGGPPSGGSHMPDSAKRLAEIWTVERTLKLLDYFDKEAESGEPLEFEGHPACWTMMALLAKLRKCDLYMYMPPFGKSLVMAPFTIGDTPVDGQIATFEAEEKGENVRLVATQADGPNPFTIPYGDTVAPKIEPGKNIYVELHGARYLEVFGVPWTYPDCKAMFMKMSDATYCIVSNTPEYKVGQTVEYPF